MFKTAASHSIRWISVRHNDLLSDIFQNDTLFFFYLSYCHQKKGTFSSIKLNTPKKKSNMACINCKKMAHSFVVKVIIFTISRYNPVFKNSASSCVIRSDGKICLSSLSKKT